MMLCWYVLSMGPRAGEARPAVVVRLNLSDESATLHVHTDPGDGLDTPILTLPDVPFAMVQTPGHWSR